MTQLTAHKTQKSINNYLKTRFKSQITLVLLDLFKNIKELHSYTAVTLLRQLHFTGVSHFCNIDTVRVKERNPTSILENGKI